MPWYDVVLLVLAGVGAGLTGSGAGLASVFSYPVLLAVGLSPVSANVTNTVALVFSSIGSVSASGPELVGQGRQIRTMIVAAVVGGIAGGALLLTAPADSFALTVPWLIALASVVILLPRRPARVVPHRHADRWLFLGIALIAVYGGYFGAAAGVLLLSLLLAMTADTFARANAFKNVLLGASNAVAAVSFVFFGPVRWLAVLPLAVGLFVGGRVGPKVVRALPDWPLRVTVATGGLILAAVLAGQTYG